MDTGKCYFVDNSAGNCAGAVTFKVWMESYSAIEVEDEWPEAPCAHVIRSLKELKTIYPECFQVVKEEKKTVA